MQIIQRIRYEVLEIKCDGGGDFHAVMDYLDEEYGVGKWQITQSRMMQGSRLIWAEGEIE